MSELTWAGIFYGVMVGFFFLAGAAFVRTMPAWLGGFFLLVALVALFVGKSNDKQIETVIRGASDPREVATVLGEPTERERAEFTLTREQPTWQVGLRAAPFFRYELTNASEHLLAYLVIPARGNDFGWAPPPLQPMALSDLEDYQQPGLGNPAKPGREQFDELTAQIGKNPNLVRFDLPPYNRAVHDCLWPHGSPPVLIVHWYRPPEDEGRAEVPLTLEFASRGIDPDAVAVRKVLSGAACALACALVGFLGVWLPAERFRFFRDGFPRSRRLP